MMSAIRDFSAVIADKVRASAACNALHITFICKFVKPARICTNVVFLMGKCQWPYGPSCLVDFIH